MRRLPSCIECLGLTLVLFACEKPPARDVARASGGAPSTAPPAASSAPPAAPLAAPTDSAQPAVPPATAANEREANTTISGCLASESGQTTAPPTRAMPSGPSVEVVPGAQPKVVHHLTHACCLRARTRIAQTGNSLILVEELYGTPCRCQCASTLTTELALAPGDYDVRVETVQGTARNEAFRGNVRVAASGDAAPASSAPRLPKTIHVPAASH